MMRDSTRYHSSSGGIILLGLFAILFSINLLSSCNVFVQANANSIPFVSMIHEENRLSDLEKDNGGIFELTKDNNLVNNVHRLNTLMMRRELTNSRESVEPYSQFIIKLKDNAITQKRMVNQVQSLISSGIPLGSSQIMSVVARTSDIINHVGDKDYQAIEWIGEYETRFKSSVHFAKIQEHAQKEGQSTSDSDLMEFIISTIPSVDAASKGDELNELEQVAKKLNSQIGSVFDASQFAPIQVVDREKMRISFSPLIAKQVSDIILENPHVHFVDRKPIYSLFNKEGSSSMQSVSPTETETTPFYDMGIYGNDQIVSVSDTGIDWDHCFYSDANITTIDVNTVYLKHRKIVEYRTVSVLSGSTIVTSDGKDSVDGHGTHVVGSVAGSIESPTSTDQLAINKYHGMAPSAKIHFTDIQKTGTSALLIPDSVTTIFNPAYKLNARIFSNSWGAAPNNLISCDYDCVNCVWAVSVSVYRKGQAVYNSDCKYLFGSDTCCSIVNRYDAQCRDIDTFLWNNQDAIILYAQGNSGRISSQANIGSPATSKNGVSVGASKTSNAAFLESVQYEDMMNRIKEAGLQFTSTDECCSYSGSNADAVRAFCCPDALKAKYNSNPTYFNSNNLASFSSRGPAIGGRIKPDVVGIGDNVVSGHSDGYTNTYQCSNISPNLYNKAALMTNQGTSMATPLLAGGVALLREYFQKKMGIANPSGPLLKAAIVQSSISLSGTVAKSNIESQRLTISSLGYPNSYEGHGRVYLGSLLKSGTRNVNLTVFEKTFTSSNEKHSWCLKMSSGVSTSSLASTVAWYDYPSSVSVVPSLIQDMDLIVNVYEKSGDKIQSLKVIPGNMQDSYDTKNNVEKVVINSIASSGTNPVYVTISVKFKTLSLAKQPYALVFSYPDGDFESVDSSSCYYSEDLPSSANVVGIAIGVIVGVIALLIIAVIVGIVLFRVCTQLKSAKERAGHMNIDSGAGTAYYYYGNNNTTGGGY